MNASSTFVGVEYVGGLISPANSKYAAENADFRHPKFSRYEPQLCRECVWQHLRCFEGCDCFCHLSGGQKYRVRTHRVILPLDNLKQIY